jgi:Pyridoxamine 5'-phosphate oxidase
VVRGGAVSPAIISLAAMALSKDEREQFLAEPHIAALSVNAGDDRAPLTVPMSYQYTPGGEPWVLTGAGSRKTRLIEATGRFSLMVDREQPTVRYVAVDGPVSRIEAGTDEQFVELIERYLRPARRQEFLDYARAKLGSQVAIYLQPQHWISADLGEA